MRNVYGAIIDNDTWRKIDTVYREDSEPRIFKLRHCWIIPQIVISSLLMRMIIMIMTTPIKFKLQNINISSPLFLTIVLARLALKTAVYSGQRRFQKNPWGVET